MFFPFLKLKITRLMRKIGLETNNSEAIYCCNQSSNKKSNPFHTHTHTHTHKIPAELKSHGPFLINV